MTEEKVKGIVTKLIDYQDADKLASIFTLEYGMITAKFTGVKKDKAKMKAIAQPFVFGEFDLNKKGDKRAVIGANLLDNFSQIISSYEKTICGYVLLDMVSSILPPEKPEQDIFLLALSSLKEIENGNEHIALIKFILKFFQFSGMGIEFPATQYVYLDKFTGDFIKQPNNTATQLDKKVYETLVKISKEDEIDVSSNVLKQILRLLHNIIFIKFGEELKSFQFV